MRTRNNHNEYAKRMICGDEASAYISIGLNKTKQLMDEIGATRRIGRRVVYDKKIIDAWLDSLADKKEGAVE